MHDSDTVFQWETVKRIKDSQALLSRKQDLLLSFSGTVCGIQIHSKGTCIPQPEREE